MAEDYTKGLYQEYSDNSKVQEYSLESKCALIGENISGEYDAHYKLAEECGMLDVQYSKKQENKNIPFAIDHVCLSNYSLECKHLRDLDANATLDQTEHLKAIDKKSASKEVLDKLDTYSSVGSKLNQVESEGMIKKLKQSSFSGAL